MYTKHDLYFPYFSADFYFNPLHCTLVIATDQLGLLRMIYSEKIRTDIVQSHLEPITAIKYSHCFDQVVTSCEGAVSGIMITS